MRKTDTTQEITPFDKKAVYEHKIQPLIDGLVKMCTVYHIPMYVTCCVANSAEKSEYQNNCVAADVHGLILADDNIQKHLCIQLGFDTVYRSEENFDFEDEATKIS